MGWWNFAQQINHLLLYPNGEDELTSHVMALMTDLSCPPLKVSTTVRRETPMQRSPMMCEFTFCFVFVVSCELKRTACLLFTPCHHNNSSLCLKAQSLSQWRLHLYSGDGWHFFAKSRLTCILFLHTDHVHAQNNCKSVTVSFVGHLSCKS